MPKPDQKDQDESKLESEKRENPTARHYRMIAEGLTNCLEAGEDGQVVELKDVSPNHANKLVAITADGYSRVINGMKNWYGYEPGFIGLAVVGKDGNQFKTIFVCDEPTESHDPTPLEKTGGFRGSLDSIPSWIGKIMPIDEGKLFHLAAMVDNADKMFDGAASQMLFESTEGVMPKAVKNLKKMMTT